MFETLGLVLLTLYFVGLLRSLSKRGFYHSHILEELTLEVPYLEDA